MLRLVVRPIVLTSIAALAGCAGTKPAVVPAKGRALFRAQPAVDALVVFHPLDAETERRIGGKPFAKVKEDGTFVLTTYAQDDGAPEGEYGVTVQWTVKSKGPKFSIGVEGGGNEGGDALQGRYGDPRNPRFKFTVRRGEPNDFELQLD